MPGCETAVGLLLTGAGATAGLGVLVGPKAVVTCAHVVNTGMISTVGSTCAALPLQAADQRM